MSRQSIAIAGAEEPAGNMSFEELVARRTQLRSEPEEAEEEETQESEEVENEEPEEQSEETEIEAEIEESDESDEETEEEEPEEIDLLSLTPEQIQQLAKKGKSRLLQRIGELTAQKKGLEEKLASQAEVKPLPKSIPAEENPFSSLKTAEEVQAKYDELERVAEETDRVLEEHEDYGADDIINFGGKDFTKKEIRTAHRNARKALLTFLPAQAAEITKADQRVAMQEKFDAAIPVEIPELADAESPMAKLLNSMLSDPLIEQVRQRVPDLSPQLGYLLAHAVRSMNSKKIPTVRQPATGTIPKAKPPGTPGGAGAARSTGTPIRKKAEQAYENFEKTGSVEDWIAARAAKHSNQ